MKVTSISKTRRNDQDIEFKRYSGIFWTCFFQVTALVADFKQLWNQFCLIYLETFLTAFVLLAAQVSLLARTCLSNLPGQQQVPSPRQVQNLDPKKVTSAESAVWHVDQWSPSLAGAACCGCAATRNSVAPALLCRAWAHALQWERRWDPPRPLNRRPCHVDVAGIGDLTVDDWVLHWDWGLVQCLFQGTISSEAKHAAEYGPRKDSLSHQQEWK